MGFSYNSLYTSSLLSYRSIFMLNFSQLSLHTFLTEYWQKKPLLIRNALPDFKNHLSPEELAGLAMEEEIESRIVIQTLGKSEQWSLKSGPFSNRDFKKLPLTHWTLLVQGVDRFIPEITGLLDNFNFIPQWRLDDVMISYAVKHGSVGPHYDNYDVFLYQAKGRRKWLLTTSNCIESNYLTGVDLRIMKEFKIEEEHILEEGDMLYLPPHVGHHGISLDDNCMTYSFGFRSYKGRELWDSFGEYLSTHPMASKLYQDPSWAKLKSTSQIPENAWIQAKALMQEMLDNDGLVRDWFGVFATDLDQHAESLLPNDKAEDTLEDKALFKPNLLSSRGLSRNPVCRIAYLKNDVSNASNSPILFTLYINGCKWHIDEVSESLVELIANNRIILLENLTPFLDNETDMSFLNDLWDLEWLEFYEEELDA